ncbi:MAG: magnesium transporter [Candidatus Marinimicrobia bacterium]|nr:magnesium transporter [Candidatus Neomarinimicrobiota bacterium]
MRNNEVLLLVRTLRKLLGRGVNPSIINILKKTHPADIALLFRSFTFVEQKKIFSLISEIEKKADILSELDDSLALNLFLSLNKSEIVKIFGKMDSDDESKLIRLLPEEKRDEYFAIMKESESLEMVAMMEYPEESAGSMMNINVFHLLEDCTVAEAIEQIRKSIDTELVFYLYVVDKRKHLVGVISLRQLILVSPHKKLKEIMIEDIVTVTPETDQEEVGKIASKYNFLAIPIVDNEFKLLGIITVDDIIDVMREEATEDLLQMAGAGKDSDILFKSAWNSTRTRFPWLFATWIGGLIAAVIITNFHDLLTNFIILASFLPIIAGMGGNIGTQTSTIITRGLATGRISLDGAWKLILKEMGIGLMLGGFYGIILGVVAYYFYDGADIFMSLAITLGIMIAMLLAVFTGSVTPIILEKIKIDPAIATGPFVTTTIDIIGIMIYLSIATILSKYIIA